MINDPQQIDFTQSYTDPAGPQAQDPSSALLAQITSAMNPTPTAPPASVAPSPVELETQPDGGATPVKEGSVGEPHTTQAPAAPAAAAPAADPQHVASTQVPGFDTTNILARLAPMGIKSIDELRTMDEAKLKKLSTDVVAFEQRQASMDRFFYRNPDGSYDFTKGPDGNPTGLDASGKFIPPGQAQQPTPAPTAPKPTAPKKPDMSGRAKGKIVAPKKAPAKKKGSAPKVTPKPKPKPKAKPKPKPKATVVRQATSRGRTAI